MASSNGLSAKQLKWYNPKVTAPKSGRLRTGQELLVPTRAVVVAALDVPDPSIEIYGSVAETRTYVVKRGETLGGIARKNGTTGERAHADQWAQEGRDPPGPGARGPRKLAAVERGALRFEIGVEVRVREVARDEQIHVEHDQDGRQGRRQTLGWSRRA